MRIRAFTGEKRLRLLFGFILALGALAPALWFTGGLPVKTVDSYFSLHPQGVFGRGLSIWDATDSTGVLSTALPAIGLNSLQGALGRLGVPVAGIEAFILCLLSAAAVAGMAMLMRGLLRGTSIAPWRKYLVITCAAILWVANPFALAFVWYHQMLIEVTWAVMPWVLWAELTAIRGDLPAKRWVPILLLIVIIGSPGLPHADLPGIGLLMTSFAIGAIFFSPDRMGAVLRSIGFAATFFVGIAWWLVPSLPYLHEFVQAAKVSKVSGEDQLLFASRYSSFANVVSLTASPLLYQKVSGTPYIPWSWLVTDGPGPVLRFILPLCALAGAIYACTQKRFKAIGLALLLPLLAAAFVSKGINQPFPQINRFIVKLPLGDAFRHPVDKLAVPLVVPMVLLFAFGVLALTKSRRMLPLGLAALAVACVWMTSPWWTSGVLLTGGGMLPSSYADVPAAYDTIGQLLNAAPAGGKTWVAPYAPYGKTAYNWPSGIQPNRDCLLQDWAPHRTVICHDAGSELADTLGTIASEAIFKADPRVFDLTRLWGIDRWIVHRDWDSAYAPAKTDPATVIGFLNNPFNLPPARELPRKRAESFAIDLPDLTFGVFVPATFGKEESVLTFGALNLKVNRASRPGYVYIGVKNNENGEWLTGTPFPTGHWRFVNISLGDTDMPLHSVSLAINSQPQGTFFECGAPTYRCRPGTGSMKIAQIPSVLQVRAAKAGTVRLTYPIVGSDLFGRPVYAGDALPAARPKNPRITTLTPTVRFAVYAKRQHQTPEETLFTAGPIEVGALWEHGAGAFLTVKNSKNRVERLYPIDVTKRLRIAMSFSAKGVAVVINGVSSGMGLDLCQWPSPSTQLCGLRNGQAIAFARGQKTFALGGLQVFGAPRPLRIQSRVLPIHVDDDLYLWQSPAVPLFYAATSAKLVGDSSAGALLTAASELRNAPFPAIVSSAVPALDPRPKLWWRHDKAWQYHGAITVKKASLLVFGQTFDPRWTVHFTGPKPAGITHILVNGYANGWIVTGEGTYYWTIRYAPETGSLTGALTAALLLALAFAALLWNIAPAARRRVEHIVYRRQEAS